MTREFQLIVLTPSGLFDPSLAIAASWTGALGILDLEYVGDNATARQAVTVLAKYARNCYGLRLHCQQEELFSELLLQDSKLLSLILLTGCDSSLLQQQIEVARQKNLRVLLEATSLVQARLGADLGVDGIVAKGNEAGGFVGDETTFVLLQKLLARLSLPIFAQGGIGLHTAAACYTAGAAGIVLDAQMALARESRLPGVIKESIISMDGSETVCLGGELGEYCRIFFKPGLGVVESLRRKEEELSHTNIQAKDKQAAWRNAVSELVDWTDPNRHVLLLGQDAAFAAPLARRFVTVSGILSAIQESIETHCEAASRLRPFNEGSPLARSHATRYPIVQGPMTRVSDSAAFARAVAKAGAMPFLALALMRKTEVVPLLEETRHELGGRSWGVGILGFVSPTVRQEQLAAIRSIGPTFALIAGGRPDQASLLEQEGIPTYLHVPSPGLLRMFLAEGSRRFVFEGRECGGHVGPRSSFVLWEMMIDILLDHLASAKENAQEFHVLFAGGIHDALSSSMVAALAAPLADLGVRLGVLMGTAYIFTQEAVTTKAIVPDYQAEVLRGERTVLLETAPGHLTRCLPTPYTHIFADQKRHLLQKKADADLIRGELEALNLGRLRMATKGVTRHPQYKQDHKIPKYINLKPNEQREQGLYMIGQVAALRDKVCTMASLHHEVSIEGSARLESLVENKTDSAGEQQYPAKPSQIAIVGMAGILPKATNLQVYWENILDKIDTVTEIPRERWDWERYFDSNRSARDKIYSKWGGFIDDVPFNPLDYGMPPNSVASIEPVQLLMLEAVRAALDDAGYSERPFLRERTSVIIGVGGGLGDLGYLYGFRSYLPHFLASESSEVISRLADMLPEWNEDSFPGILLNVVAGRIANRFDLGGPNFVVDAACGSSLAALDVAIKYLETHQTDIAIVGAGDTVQSPFAYLAFSRTQALSPSGRCRPFDASADGIAISEGLSAVILKRLEDAERDGDRIYAVVQGVGASSDGRDKGLTAPRPAGQLRALRRAYIKAGVSVDTVGLIEAHGTGTRVGDPVEVEALNDFFRIFQAGRQTCAIGSVKSMIGHTKSTAGLAGLIKAALALYHKVLPPTLVDKPNPKIDFADSPFYVNSEARPWLTETADQVRRAGVSAFGFGGTNFHAVLEEYRDGYLPERANRLTWSAELFLWHRRDRAALLSEIDKVAGWLSAGSEPLLRDLAYSLYLRYRQSVEESPIDQLNGLVLSIVATSLDDLMQKLDQARARLSAGEATINDPRGIYFAEQPLGTPDDTAKIVFLFPGQGSQYPNMLRDLTLQFPQVRLCFEQANHILKEQLSEPLSKYIFPIPAYSDEETQANREALTATRIAQPALGTASLALCNLLKEMGVRPDIVAGHSYGEIVALCEAGVISQKDLLLISEARGRFMAEATGPESGTMAAVKADRETVTTALQGLETLTLANLNAPTQTVISGPQASIVQATEQLKAQGISARLLPVACAFHSPFVAPAGKRLAEFLETIEFKSPTIDVYSNTTAGPYPKAPEAIRALLTEHLIHPVEFQKEVEAMHAAGARIFVETGPRSVLSNLVGQILRDRPHLAIPVDQPTGSGLTLLQKALAQLAAAGVPLHLELLYDSREVTSLDLNRPDEQPHQARFGSTTWLVNGSRARPWRDVQNNVPEHAITPLKVKLSEQDTAFSVESADRSDVGAPIRRMSHPDVAARNQPTTADTPQPVGPSSPYIEGVDTGGDNASQVLLQYQQLMSRFLENQKDLMLTYLRATPIVSGQDRVAQKHVSSVLHPADQLSRPTTPPPVEAGTSQETSMPPEQMMMPAVNALPLDDAMDGGATNGIDSTLDPETLTQNLLSFVSERTGYPPEMLELDADLEADLGIDSIKRVEILGMVRAKHPLLETLLSGQGMEQLQSLRSLGTIVDWIVSQVESQEGSSVLAVESQEYADPTTPSAHTAPILRFELSPTETPLTGSAGSLSADRVILITVDGGNIGRSVADTLRSRGHQVVLVADGGQTTKTGPDFFTVDLTSPAAVDGMLELIRGEHGPIGSLLHLASLSSGQEFESMTLDNWQESLRRRIGSLFYLIQGLYEDLVSSAQAGGSCLLAATDMGGVFASGKKGGSSTFFPAQGGLVGLLKTVAREWPAVRVKAVDLNLRQDPSLAVEAILQELTADDGLVEVGYNGAIRKTLQMVPMPLNVTEPASLTIDSRSVILLTGGARGITAQVAQELAVRFQPIILLVGRSPLPAPAESPQTAGLTSKKSIKEVIIAALSQNGQQASLAEVEVAYNRLLREREMRANLAAVQQAGATVQYYQVDVRDETVFGALIDDIYSTYGRLDGVIHGAGIIEDKLVKDKTLSSFERVISTKVDSAFILSRKLRPETLKFLVFFSSVSGRFGNKGQSDYAVANEILNKLAIYLNQHWPARVVSVNWGPWDGAGMVSRELRQEFKRRGINLIPTALGRQLLIEELQFGRKDEAEVMICGKDVKVMAKQ